MPSKAQGYNSHLLLKRQDNWGAAAAGPWVQMPFNGTGLSKRWPYAASKLAGQGRDPTEVEDGEIEVSGDNGRVPLDPRYIGYWLTGLLGDPVSAGAEAPYTHTFKSGASTIPVYTAEVGHKGPGKFEVFDSVFVAGMTFNYLPQQGIAEAAVRLIGREMTPYNATQGGVATTHTYSPISNYKGTIKKDGVALASITSASITVNNNAEPFREGNTTGPISGFDLGETDITAALGSRFTDYSLPTLAYARTAFELELMWTLAAGLSLKLSLHEALLEPSGQEISGPAGYDQQYVLKSRKNAAAGASLTAVLINDLAGATYTDGA